VFGSDKPEPYKKIDIREIYSKMIIRNDNDPVHSGQIKSTEGLAKFQKTYGITVNVENVDFKSQFLIFGLTDNITTRAIQFLNQERSHRYTLDYAETGIDYFMTTPKGKKPSYMQIFVLDRIERGFCINIKNVIKSGRSEMYGMDRNITNISASAKEPEGLVLYAYLSSHDGTNRLDVQLINYSEMAISVPALDSNTLILSDKDGNHIGLGSNKGRNDKIIVLKGHRRLLKGFEFPETKFSTNDIYLTHFTRFKEIEYESIKIKVNNYIR